VFTVVCEHSVTCSQEHSFTANVTRGLCCCKARSRGGDGALIVAVVNLKGGVGKSTSAVYFATVAIGGAEVVVLDADTERSALEWAAAGELPFEVVAAERDRLARQARELEGNRGDGRVVIVDTPPNDREVLRTAASVADRVVVPVAPTGVDVNRLRATLEVLLDVEATTGELDTSILLTRWDGRKRLAREAEELVGRFPLLDARIRALTRYEDGFGGRPWYLEEYGTAWEEVVGG
jgi:chromosome partitioning protein